MQGFTITNGDASNAANPDGPAASGGGIRDQGNASLTLTNMVVAGNVASADGGGISMENIVSETWTLTINNSTISNNHAGDAGGGIDTDGSGTVHVNSGSTITGNSAVNQGGGVNLDAIQVGSVFHSASLTMTSVVISNNSGGSGGGISNTGNGAVQLSACSVTGNTAGQTGGGFGDANGQGSLAVQGSVFLNNSATGSGGGIQTGGSIASLAATELEGNTSGATGGGLLDNGVTLSVQGVTFADNSAAGGGGGIELGASGSSAAGSAIIDSTFAGNNALNNSGANGGGIEAGSVFTGSVSLVNDTINGNFATDGGGIFWNGSAGSVGLENTIVAANFASVGPDANNPAGAFADIGGNLIGVAGAGGGNTGFNSGSTQTGTVAHPLDPMLGPLQSYGGPIIGTGSAAMILATEAPLSLSPAMDKGILAGVPASDERGLPTVVNGKVNVGAVSPANLDTITGSTGVDQITLIQDTDHVHIDWFIGASSGQLLINDFAGLSINGDGGNDVITLVYTNGNPLPNLLHLGGTFTINGLTGTNPLAGTTLDIGRSTVFITYASASDPIAAIKTYLRNGYNAGAWNGTPTASTGVITSTAAQLNPSHSTAVGSADFADGQGVDTTANTIELKYTLYGDANLDTQVNSADLQILLFNLNRAGSWDQGDFNYDGQANSADLQALLFTLNASLGSQAVPATSATAATLASATKQLVASTALSKSSALNASASGKAHDRVAHPRRH